MGWWWCTQRSSVTYIISNAVGFLHRYAFKLPDPDAGSRGLNFRLAQWPAHTANILSHANAACEAYRDDRGMCSRVGTGDQGASGNGIGVQGGDPLGRWEYGVPVAESRYRYDADDPCLSSSRRLIFTNRYRDLALILSLAPMRSVLSHNSRTPMGRTRSRRVTREMEYSACAGRALYRVHDDLGTGERCIDR